MRSRPRHVVGWVAAAVIVATLATPAAAPAAGVDALGFARRVSASDPLASLSPSGRRATNEALERVRDIRSAVAGGRLVDAVRSIAAAGDGVVPATPTLPSPTQHLLAGLTDVPTSLRGPVAGLSAAVAKARDLLGPYPANEVRRALGSIFRGLQTFKQRALANARTVTTPLTMKLHLAKSRMFAPTQRFGNPGLDPGVTRAVHNDLRAALLIAAALDAYIPMLQAQRDRAAPVSEAVGCDILDRSPLLCIGSEADNTYTTSEMLLIDMGGDDTFENSAGGAPFVSDETYVPISINVSLGGDDTYAAPLLPILPGTQQSARGDAIVLGQGSGLVGGLGMLIDTAGNDSFEAVAPDVPPDTGAKIPTVAVVGQGASIFGFGLSFDGAGNDSYSTRGVSSDRRVLTAVAAQGADVRAVGNDENSEGALVDTGGGSDTYVLDAGSGVTQGAPAFVQMTALGQGASNIGTAALVDDGGVDSFRTVATASTNEHVEGSHGFQAPMFDISAQASSAEGTALLLEGPGAHTYTMEAHADGTAAETFGFKGQAAADIGTSVLQDLGSSATYRLSQTLSDRHTFTVGDSCGACASVNVDPYTREFGFSPINVMGQGASHLGVAVLDNHGTGAFTAVAAATIDDTIDDRRSAPTDPASLDVTAHFNPRIVAQGATAPGLFLFPVPSIGLLLNRQGHADFSATNRDSVSVSGIGSSGLEPVVTGRSLPQFDYASMQGAGYWNSWAPPGAGEGALIDFGPNDTFTAIQDHSVTTTPDTGRSFSSGAFWDPMQGAGNGGVFVAGGTSPVAISSPSNGVCPTSPSARGAGSWADCSMYTLPGTDEDHTSYDFLGGNTAPGNAVGYSSTPALPVPQLDLTAPPTIVDGDATPVKVQLEDPSGVPVANAVVHLDLQAGLEIAGGRTQWLNTAQTDAVTDAAGTAEVALPVALKELWVVDPIVLAPARVMATFDGSADLGSRHVSAPVEVSFGGPSPTPTPTPTSTSTPEERTTSLHFTPRSATATQYSDQSLFEARLTGADGSPLSARELTFELKGNASTRSFTATTDSDGVARVTPTITERPGAYQLTVRYSGSPAEDGSADVTGFSVDKEDTMLTLAESTSSKTKHLSSTLVDRDSGQGIAGRTLDFYADGNLIGSGTTDSQGRASVEVPPKYKGSKVYEARFEADDFYRFSSASLRK